MNMGKMFIVLGMVFIILGIFWTFIGKLPGDFTFKKGNVTFHFPLMTSIVVSIILSLLFLLINKFR